MTGKPLEIIVDESLYDLPEVNDLVEQGHTIKKLKDLGYDGILGPKASNLTAADIKANPKLLEIALIKFKELKYPKDLKPVKAKKVKVKTNVVENTEASTGEAAAGVTEEAPVRKRRTRRTKQQIEADNLRAAAAVRADESRAGIDTTPIVPGDSTDTAEGE